MPRAAPPRRGRRIATDSRAGRLAASVWLVAALGCNDDPTLSPIPDERIVRGRYVVLHVDPRADVCDASVEHADRFVEVTSELLGVTPPQLDYYVYAELDDFDCASPGEPRSGAWACAFRNQPTVMAYQGILQHEIVHVLAMRIGDAPAILEEGLATMLSAEASPGPGALVDRTLPIEDNLASIDFVSLDASVWVPMYESMASFLRHVVDRFGAGVLVRWYDVLDNFSPADTTRQSFADASGVPLDDALSEWRAGPPALVRAAHLRLLECATEPSEPEGTELGMDAQFACGRQDTPTETSHRFETRDVGMDGLYALEVPEGAEPVRLELSECAGAHDPVHITWPGEQGLVILRAGRHSIWTTIRRQGAPRVRWSLRRLGAAARACEDAIEIPTPRGNARPQLLGSTESWPGETDDPELGAARVTWVRIAAEPEAGSLLVRRERRDVNERTSDPRATILVCSGQCGSLGGCQPLPTSGEITVPTLAGLPTVLELRATSAPFNETIRIAAGT